MYGDIGAQESSGYHLLPNFAVDNPNYQHWHNIEVTPLVGSIDEQIIMHPNYQDAILGWRSPVNATITVHATISHHQPTCIAPQDGILWSLDQGTRLLQTGALKPGQQQTVDITASVAVGDSLYLIVDGGANTNCDTTNVDEIVEVAGVTAVPPSAPAPSVPPSPFTGTWWAIDGGDGSVQQLIFESNGTILYRDDYSTVCGGASDGFSKDTGTISADGKTWTGSGTASFQCPSTGYNYAPINYTFTLNPDGTLTGPWPNNWTRGHP